MKQIFLLIIIFVLFQIPSLALNSDRVNAGVKNDIHLTNRDKAQIVETVLSKYDFLNRHLYQAEKRNVVYLSTDNIPPRFVPSVSGISFILIRQKEIKEKTKNGFRYFAFEKFKAEGQKVLISFAYFYKDTGSQNRYEGSSGSSDMTTGINYEFQKVSGKWQGKAINGFQVQS